MTTARRELAARIWSRDPTVWTGRDEARWLGWLDEPFRMRDEAETLSEQVAALSDGFEEVVLFGMGGSSLAADVFRQAFGSTRLHVLDTTHPTTIRSLESGLDLPKTLFLAASKSGSTIETRAHLEYFWKRAPHGRQWAVVTDPGSELAHVAHERAFAAVFPGEPTIGGRYSALSPFGLVPAALAGADLARLLDRACAMAEACRLDAGNPGLDLGLALGDGWNDGRDKVCVTNPHGFGLWVEQLVAESTGKDGKGLIPVPGSQATGPDCQSHDVLLTDPYDLGAAFFCWEFATAVAGAHLGVHPFDQPDVQSAKDRTTIALEKGDAPLASISSAEELYASARAGDYVCVQAFVDPTSKTLEAVSAIAEHARAATGCVVTTGFGPRYLHSTGQLHKGGPNTGLFLQVVEEYEPELEIPGHPFGFGQLIRAQAAGDLDALVERDRRVARIVL